MPRLRLDDLDAFLDDDDAAASSRRARNAIERDDDELDDEPLERSTKRRTADGQESFKCGHCRAFIGPTVSGGRHRNHCPLCLYSRHVDAKSPGDRASACRSLMAPVGVFYRPKGEQVILHRCLGCGLERHCRVAADDNPIILADLPVVDARLGREPGAGGQESGVGDDADVTVDALSFSDP